MDASAIVGRLGSFSDTLVPLVAGLSEPEIRFKPPSGAWSILEIVNHLADEEVEDFRARLELVLRDPTLQWAPIDPEGWARDRRYNERDPAQSARRFVDERLRSMAWLRGVLGASPPPDWSRAHRHPKFGPISAGDLLGSWAAHDALHLRQIAKRLHELAGRDAGTFKTVYAGEWRA